MITIDGSYGEGGGQILRTAMGLAAIAGKPLTIENVRAGRRKPGLQRQHLCAIQAVNGICQGELVGDALGSKTIQFYPAEICGGEYVFRIGSAGSVTLVAQSILIPLMRSASSSRIRIHGGTHNPLAPPFDFFDRVYLPRLRQWGVNAAAELIQHGFYPKGGGEIDLRVNATGPMSGLDILERGRLCSATVHALIAGLPQHIADRELDVIKRRSRFPIDDLQSIEIGHDTGPGNVVMIDLTFEHARHLVIEFGQRGVPAEQVAARALRQANSFLKADVPIGEHLADQLLLPAAMAGAFFGQVSRYVIGKPSLHTTTHIWLLEQLLDVIVELTPLGDDDRHQVLIRPGP